jgi:hypothetical protein
MLSFPQTKVFQSIERAVAAGFTIDQEGKALTWTSVSGVSGVRKSAGTGTEVFAGVALNMLYLPVEVPFSERLTQASLAITLSNTPLGGTLRVYNVTTATVFTAGNGTDANTYSLSGVTATLPVANNGNVFLVSYRFAPTVAQAQAFWGNVHPGGPAGAYLGQIGVIQKGDVFTTEYDTAVDWTVAAPVVRLGANGVFTTAGSGTILSNVTVIQAPDLGVGALGLEIR